jgi:hypothetical protein
MARKRPPAEVVEAIAAAYQDRGGKRPWTDADADTRGIMLDTVAGVLRHAAEAPVEVRTALVSWLLARPNTP